MNTALNLQIKDNFFSKKEYDILVNNLDKVLYSPNVNEEVGLYSQSHHFNPTNENKWIFSKIKNNFFPNNNKLKIISAEFSLRDNKNLISPHKDSFPNNGENKSNYNCLIYLKGRELIYNGTGFYTNGNLNTYIGFVENRGIFFKGSDVYHTCLQGLGESSARYCLNVYYGEKI
tara:strand:+ start:53 stop:574 length:522 start_codon:yes stop_codon:yes gene_type:complete